jgi:hypothetical protein
MLRENSKDLRRNKSGLKQIDKNTKRQATIKEKNGFIKSFSKNFKTTHITAGGLKDKDPQHQDWLDTIEIAKTIKWILDQSSISIPILGIEEL